MVSAAIGPIQGTSYNFALAVPLSMYDPDTGAYEAGSVRTGEVVKFLLNDTPAVFRDANNIAQSQFTLPADAMGKTYLLGLTITGPGGYPLGDANVNGRRDSADALLVLKYDVGLIAGDTNFPPAPGKIYLPLCDIVQDGRCNSSDALRILQCDAQMPGVSCPDQPGQLSAAPDRSTALASAPLMIRGELAAVAPGSLTVRVSVNGEALGATSLELRYDPALLTPAGCDANPTGTLSAAACNPAYAAGVVRINGVSATGQATLTTLADVRFNVSDPQAFAGSASAGGALALVVREASDRAGHDLAWRIEGLPGALRSERDKRVYLPLLTPAGAVRMGVTQPATSSSPPPAEPRNDAPYRLYLPTLGGR